MNFSLFLMVSYLVPPWRPLQTRHAEPQFPSYLADPLPGLWRMVKGFFAISEIKIKEYTCLVPFRKEHIHWKGDSVRYE